MIPERTLFHLNGMEQADLDLLVELADLIATRPRPSPSMPARLRRDDAQFHMASVLDFAYRVCGDGTVQDAYGPLENDREKLLQSLAERANLASYAFGPHDRGAGSLRAAASEARAVAQGDKPELFAKIGRRRAIVLLRAKFDALRWDAWLNGIGTTVDGRHKAIEEAFGAPWDTISRWRGDVESAWGREALTQIEMDRMDGSRGLRMWSMSPDQPWETELQKAGGRYVAALKMR